MVGEFPDGPGLVYQTVQQSVVDYLRELILSGLLAPGERLVQSELAERLQVSRTPVREALHQLASEGLVTISSYKGASVAAFSLSEIEDVYAIRCALESHAAYLAARSITAETLAQLETLLDQMAEAFQRGDRVQLLELHHQFHVGVYAAAQRSRLYDLAVRHLGLTNVYQRMALSLGRGARDPLVEHQEIVDALRRGDAESAGRLMRDHLQATVEELLALFQKDQAQGADD
ncbi:MAG TPA: GntR family transcriptional regulator [Chloroflexi bacterium]|nr:GntR family transcriptional regulator [Chloroflexota bacterium]